MTKKEKDTNAKKAQPSAKQTNKPAKNQSTIIKLAKISPKLAKDCLDRKYKAQLYTVLNAVKANMSEPPARGRVHFSSHGKIISYSYVTLKDMIATVNKALRGTGLSFYQNAKDTAAHMPRIDYKSKRLYYSIGVMVRVSTTIYYKNGSSITTGFKSIPPAEDAKSVGSATTTARRYSLAQAFGISGQTDTDGGDFNRNNNRGFGKRRQSGGFGQYQNKNFSSGNRSWNNTSWRNNGYHNSSQPRQASSNGLATESQKQKIGQLISKYASLKGSNKAEVQAQVKETGADVKNIFGSSSPKAKKPMTSKQAQNAIVYLNGFITGRKNTNKAMKK